LISLGLRVADGGVVVVAVGLSPKRIAWSWPSSSLAGMEKGGLRRLLLFSCYLYFISWNGFTTPSGILV
jgi:hypothetical protein